MATTPTGLEFLTESIATTVRHPRLGFLAILLLTSLCGQSDFSSRALFAQAITIGKAQYREDLPPDAHAKARRLMKAKPLVSAQFVGAVPTNDWCSSLVWPLQSPYSLPMFAHPFAMQAQESGLGLGYTPVASVTSSRKDGKLFQSGTDYRYPYAESMVVGLADFASADSVLDRHSDWATTALWKDKKNPRDQLRATFGHGLPFVYFERQSNKPAKIRFKAAKIDRHKTPVAPRVYQLRGINAKHTQADGRIHLSVNAGANVGVGCKARVRYDFDGDGDADRTETWQLMATDPAEATWEPYSSDRKPIDETLTYGQKQDFQNGSITLEFWKCFGKGRLQLQLNDCYLQLPIEGGKRFLSGDGSLQTEAEGEEAIADLPDAKAAKASVFCRRENVLGVTVNNTHYGLFAPTGSQWKSSDESFAEVTSDLAGKNYWSVAVLPDAKPSTIAWFERYAFAFVTDTRIEYQYNQQAAKVTTKFSASTDVKEGSNSETVFALYRHQSLHLVETNQRSPYQYVCPRGKMKVVAGDSFSTATPFLGVLPTLPCAESAKGSLSAMVDDYFDKVTSRKKTFERDDTYWNGKEFGKISEIIHIADQLGKTETRDRLVKLLEQRIEDWADAEGPLFFYYDSTWDTLIGYPDSYGSADQLNDHHFHYSYFIRAAATIAQFDPDWVKPENYGGLIDLLIRDCANDDRQDERFPWMRFFDPYAGHSWASGHAGFAAGNNQESSSESMNFATALILYGEVTQNKRIRDLGIYWHATEAEAIRNYWFDNDRKIFPNDYGHRCVGMIWGNGGTYGTWWTANPEEIHGINFLPLTAGSLYLGRDFDYVKSNVADLVDSNRNYHNGGFDGDPDRFDRWQDVLAQYEALADPVAAKKRYDAMGKAEESEFGETKAHTLQWITALAALGHYDTTVSANHPNAVTFLKDGNRSYVVYNAASTDKTVTFSDGKRFTVPHGLHTFNK